MGQKWESLEWEKVGIVGMGQKWESLEWDKSENRWNGTKVKIVRMGQKWESVEWEKVGIVRMGKSENRWNGTKVGIVRMGKVGIVRIGKVGIIEMEMRYLLWFSDIFIWLIKWIIFNTKKTKILLTEIYDTEAKVSWGW